MERKQSELTVITKAKDLCSYVMTVTQKSPKQFRFTFVSRLQNLALSAIENLFRANDVFVSKADMHSQKERLSYQRSAMTDLKLLGYIALLSMEASYLAYRNLLWFSAIIVLKGGWIVECTAINRKIPRKTFYSSSRYSSFAFCPCHTR